MPQLSALLVFAALFAEQPKPTIDRIHSMENCAPCDAIIARIKADGGKVSEPKKTGIQHATSYPTIVYSDGSWDNGRRVQRGNYTVDTNTTIPITKLVQK
jgi:hypothetical protein